MSTIKGSCGDRNFGFYWFETERSKDNSFIYGQFQIIVANNELLKAENKFSACAGICYCHPHYPFHRAYEIAEELCSNAKAKSKTYRIQIITTWA